jgi:Tol biopolymer transport system component
MTRKILLLFILLNLAHAADKPKLTIDEFFNSVSFDSVKVSPDGSAVVIVTDRPDWDRKIFRTDLWLYRVGEHEGSLIQLTQSGHDRHPDWSPDGRWIVFVSDRKSASTKETDSDEDSKEDGTAQLYLISPSGG